MRSRGGIDSLLYIIFKSIAFRKSFDMGGEMGIPSCFNKEAESIPKMENFPFINKYEN